jgi:hypothetical protein
MHRRARVERVFEIDLQKAVLAIDAAELGLSGVASKSVARWYGVPTTGVNGAFS